VQPAQEQSARASKTAAMRAVPNSAAQATGQHRAYSDRIADTDRQARRIALPKAFGFVLLGWILFVPLDAYVALVVDPGASVRWVVLWRALGTLPPLAGWLVTRRRQSISWASAPLELLTYCGLAFCLAMRGMAYGGLDSRMMQGVSLLLMVQTMAVPLRWSRMVMPVLATYVVYPFTMLAAALVSPSIAAQWHGGTLQSFVVDYTFVAAFAVGGVIGGHILWSMRRQLYNARRLGRYRLKARIGHGGSSEVWLAWDETLKRDIALKILDRSSSTDDVALRRFEREAMAASGLQSPHTIRVFDFGASDDGIWFMAMEYLEGVDLATLVDEVGPLPVAAAVHFARQACSALAEAHDAGVIHRDVKPDNLFICRLGDQADFLKVLDFGIAKMEGSEEDASVTRSGWVHGTPSYMSPEACNGTRVDARSDVYSMGAVLYFLLTATPPFTAATGAAVMLAHVSEVPDRPSSRVPMPADIETVIMRCLDKEPDGRFQSARELDAALASCVDASGTRARVSTEAPVATRARPDRPPGPNADREETTATMPKSRTSIKRG
jgi:serine/threonine-protein kinase